MKSIKKLITNIFTTTGITLVILAFIAAFHNAEFLFVSSVFESFGANIAIHAGFLLTRKFESKYVILEAALDISYVIAVLLTFGYIFNWYDNGTPAWVLIIMAAVIYITGLAFNLYRVREDINAINKLLRKRNEE